MNKNFNCFQFVPILDHLKHGVSPLHSWIRFFEFVLHTGHKISVRKWRITSPEDKILFSERKKYIQKVLRERLALKVDQPKQGGFGSTNVGNTARRAFNNYEFFSEITGVDIQILLNMGTIPLVYHVNFH